jgi:putative oxidoreductase
MLKFLGKYRDTGLLVIRLGLGFMFCLHGLPKLAGGPKLWAMLGKAMATVGIDILPAFWGFMAAATEGIGGVLLIIGFAYRPVCLLLTFTMCIAALKLHHDKADFQTIASRPIEMACVFIGLALIGPGRYSVDKD